MQRLLIFVAPALALALAGCRPSGASGQAAQPATPSRVAASSPAVSPPSAVSAPPQRVLLPGDEGAGGQAAAKAARGAEVLPGPGGRPGSAPTPLRPSGRSRTRKACTRGMP